MSSYLSAASFLLCALAPSHQNFSVENIDQQVHHDVGQQFLKCGKIIVFHENFEFYWVGQMLLGKVRIIKFQEMSRKLKNFHKSDQAITPGQVLPRNNSCKWFHWPRSSSPCRSICRRIPSIWWESCWSNRSRWRWPHHPCRKLSFCHFATILHSGYCAKISGKSTGEPIICGLHWHCKLCFFSVDSSEIVWLLFWGLCLWHRWILPRRKIILRYLYGIRNTKLEFSTPNGFWLSGYTPDWDTIILVSILKLQHNCDWLCLLLQATPDG